MDLSLITHISGGAVALIAGAFALCVTKGGVPHKRAGYVFVAAMTVMALTGGVVSYVVGKPFDVLSSWLTLYMILTAWIAFRPPAKRIVLGLMCLGGGCLAGYLAVELYAIATDIRATDAPTGAGYIFATILAAALFGDYKTLRQTYSRKQQTVRHLWRMNFGLLIATVSFFGARPHIFPTGLQDSGVLVLLTFAPLLLMAYWRFRLRTH